MVALHNRKLTEGDIWPDLIRTWDDELRVQRRIEAQMIDEGIDRSDFSFRFEFDKRMSRYRMDTDGGGMRQRQQVMRKIYPPKAASKNFTEEEIEKIMDRFEIANDELGQSIYRKAAKMLGIELPEPENTLSDMDGPGF